jgi:hypothetical protein
MTTRSYLFYSRAIAKRLKPLYRAGPKGRQRNRKANNDFAILSLVEGLDGRPQSTTLSVYQAQFVVVVAGVVSGGVLPNANTLINSFPSAPA